MVDLGGGVGLAEEATDVQVERKSGGDSGRNLKRAAGRKAIRPAIQWEQAAPGERLDDLISLQLLARRLRTLRLMSGLTLDEVADRADLSRSTLYQLERAATTRPRGQTLHRLAEAYGVSIDDLLLHVPEHRPADHLGEKGHASEPRHGVGGRDGAGVSRSQARELRWVDGPTATPVVGWTSATEPHPPTAHAAPSPTNSLTTTSPDYHANATASAQRPRTAALAGEHEVTSAEHDRPSQAGDPVGGLPKPQWMALPRAVREAVLQATSTHPELFQRWSERDWQEFVTDSLATVLGPNGLLPAGAIVQRARQWQAIRQLRGVLASPLAELAVGLVAQLHASLHQQPAVSSP
ncbi:MAG: helix-turn-helix domain-containing protein [Planctomycetaceae bacterium]